jgi:hypothetical protein
MMDIAGCYIHLHSKTLRVKMDIAGCIETLVMLCQTKACPFEEGSNVDMFVFFLLQLSRYKMVIPPRT